MDNRTWWCMKCGASATYLMASMDPAYGIGLCRAGVKNHDRMLITPRREEVELLLAEIAKTKAAIRRERVAANDPRVAPHHKATAGLPYVGPNPFWPEPDHT